MTMAVNLAPERTKPDLSHQQQEVFKQAGVLDS
jgi:hypothetical protein